MSKFNNFEIKWPKSVEKLENGGRLPPPPRLAPPPPPKKWLAGSAPECTFCSGHKESTHVQQMCVSGVGMTMSFMM